VGDAALQDIARGQRDAAADVGAPIVGGNLSRGSTLSLCTTLVGVCDRPVTRAGARPGDRLWLAGQVGLAAAGLRALRGGRAGDETLQKAIAAWRTPRALIASGRVMAKTAHAAIDVSDGLARDVGHVAEASAVEIVLDAGELRRDADLLEASRTLGVDPLELALHGGEDYALVAASDRPIEGFRPIGEVRTGKGLVLRDGAQECPLAPRGFDHFGPR
jgi:thiamine-monophosphate kinase